MREFFEHVEDAVIGFLAPEQRGFASRCGSSNLKLWYGDEPRVHFEVQYVNPAVAGLPPGPALEIGFHAEHADAARNDAVLARVLAREQQWRKALGREPVAGPFLGGRAKAWRRLSEVWDGPGLLGPEGATEAAERLAAYITALGTS